MDSSNDTSKAMFNIMARRDPPFRENSSSDKCLPTRLPRYVNIKLMYPWYLVQAKIKQHFEKMKRIR